MAGDCVLLGFTDLTNVLLVVTLRFRERNDNVLSRVVDPGHVHASRRR